MKDLPCERHLPLGPLARRCQVSPEHLAEVLISRGYTVRRLSPRGLRVPESEWLRYLTDCEVGHVDAPGDPA